MNKERLEKLCNKMYYSYLDEEEAQELIDYYKNMEQENKHLSIQLDQALKDYENAVSDYEQEHYKVVKAIEYIKNCNSKIDLNYVSDLATKELLEILGGKEQ